MIFPFRFIDVLEPGDNLTETYAMTHLLRLKNPLIRSIPLDQAPGKDTYGKNYVIGSSGT